MTVDEKIIKTINSCTKPIHFNVAQKLVDNTYNVLLRQNKMTKEQADIWLNKMKSRLLQKVS